MTILDWGICSSYLILVFALGWWYARGQKSNEDYLVGGRKMSWLAVGVSLFATTFSALSFVGLPREAAYDDYHLYLAILFIPLFVAPIVGWLFVPLFHRLELISAYEYLERRFHRRLRLTASLLACLYTLGWMGTMLYATGLILQVVLGLSNSQLVWTLIGLGMATTVYTSVGGFKAVVLTDIFQAVVLFGAMLLVLCLALTRIEGGWETVWQLGVDYDKFQMFDLHFDLTDRANFYTACAYGMFVYLAAHATGQAAVQRYVSMPNVAAARRSLVVNGILVACLCLLFFVVGTTIFAYYHQSLPVGFDPGSGFPDVAKKDHLTAHFIQSELMIPGLMGLLLAGLFAAAMSSIDSGVNSITALVVCDWMDGKKPHVALSRLLCLLIGVFAIVTALLVPSLGEHVFDIIITIAGAFFGPLLALFLLGMFVRRANVLGAALGLLAGVVSLAIVMPTNISPWWYGAFTCIPTFVVGILASFLAKPPDPDQIHELVVGGKHRTADNR